MNPMDEQASSSDQSGNGYPMVYRVVTWARITTVIAWLFIGPGLTYGTIFYPPPHAGGEFYATFAGIDVTLLAGTVYAITWAFTARIILYENRFEQRKPFIHRVLDIGDIKGRRLTTGRGAGHPVIVPMPGKGISFSMDETAYGFDERFYRWFNRLPDLRH